jgi:hypothetical protein
VSPRGACTIAALGAAAATAGDLLLLWVGNAGRSDLPGLPAPPAGALVLGHHLGIFGIPLYAAGYWGVSRALPPRGARAVFVLGTAGSALGAALHGMTTLVIDARRAAGAAGGDPLALVAAEGVYLVTPWLALAGLLAAGSLVFAVAVGRGGSGLPRWMALANPLAALALTSALGSASLPARAFLLPAGPNLVHVAFFGLAAWAWRGGVATAAGSQAPPRPAGASAKPER